MQFLHFFFFSDKFYLSILFNHNCIHCLYFIISFVPYIKITCIFCDIDDNSKFSIIRKFYCAHVKRNSKHATLRFFDSNITCIHDKTNIQKKFEQRQLFFSTKVKKIQKHDLAIATKIFHLGKKRRMAC